jgi:hypothetical protein
MYWYKIVDKDNSGRYKTLFHGIDGSKVIPVDEWVRSDQKGVRDGTGGTLYVSGWHVMMNLCECREYLSRFTANKDRVIVEIDVRGFIWSKDHSPSNVHLCDEIKIIAEVV